MIELDQKTLDITSKDNINYSFWKNNGLYQHNYVTPFTTLTDLTKNAFKRGFLFKTFEKNYSQTQPILILYI